MSEVFNTKALTSFLSGTFKIALTSHPKHVYQEHYRRKWIPDTTLPEISRFEFGIDMNTWITLVDEGTFNNAMVD